MSVSLCFSASHIKNKKYPKVICKFNRMLICNTVVFLEPDELVILLYISCIRTERQEQL